MTQSIDSILIPTDGSDGAESGARRGIDLAATVGADLHLLSVVDTGGLDSRSRLQPDDLMLDEAANRAVQTLAEAATPTVSGPITTAVEEGIPHEAINAYADAHDIDLIAMGTHGRTGLKRVLLGSVAEKTLRTATIPILLVPPADSVEIGEVSYENILLPTDGSPGAEIAVEWAVSLAVVSDARLHTVYSVDTSRFGGHGGISEVYDTLEKTGEAALERVREHARAADLSVIGVLANGPAVRVILSYVEEHDIDLLIMGTHGRSGVERHLIGSITEGVVRNSTIPVWCVPMPDA